MATKKLSTVITIGGAISGSLRSAFGAVKSQTAQVGAAVKQLTDRQRELNRVISDQERLGRSGSALKVQYAQQELAIIGKQIAAQQRLQAIEESRQRNLARRSKLRGDMVETAAVGAAIALPAGAAIKRSSEFNYQLQAIGNTADMTDEQVKALGRDIMVISNEVGKSAQDTQRALGFLVAAGMDVPLARDNLRAVGRTATATASEIEDVAKASFTLNDALKIQPTQMQKALDMLVQSGKEGNFEFKDMAAELPVLGAGLQSLKMTGTEAVATIGAALQIARKGAGSSQQAATNVENFLAKVLSPETLKKASKLGSDLYGVVSRAQKKGENPFEAAIKEINRVTKGGDAKLLGELFQDMQVQNFLRPMLQNLKEYERIKKAALEADGVTDRDFQKMAKTTKQQLDEMANAAGRAGIAIGNSLEPAVGRLAAVLTPVVRGITNFVDSNRELVGTAILVAGGLTAVRLGVLATQFAFTFLRGGALNVIGLFTRLSPMVSAAGWALRLASVAMGALGAAIAATPIGWVVAGIAAIAAGGALVYKYWEPLKAFFSGFFDGLLSGLAPIGQSIATAFAPVVDFLAPIVVPVLDTIGGWVKSAVSWFGDLLTPIDAASQTTAAFGEAGKACGQVVADAFTFMLTPITSVLDSIKWINDNIGGVITKAQGLWAATKNTLGFGDEGGKQPAAAAPAGAQLPPPPAMAGGRGGQSVQQTQQNTFHITQQPGENAEQLADRVARKLQNQQAVRGRSSMVDPVTQ